MNRNMIIISLAISLFFSCSIVAEARSQHTIPVTVASNPIATTTSASTVSAGTTQVQIFTCISGEVDTLQKKINTWLSENREKIQVKQILTTDLTVERGGHYPSLVLTIMYEQMQ